MAKKPAMDRLTGQLYHLPGIIGDLGVSVANAQKLLNLDYVENLKKIIGLMQRLLKDAGDDEKMESISNLLKAMAPPRYAFSETTLDFKADLSETSNKTSQMAFGAGVSAVTMSAARAKSFGYDYRAAASISTKLLAFDADPAAFDKLIAQSKELPGLTNLNMPELSTVEKELWDGMADITNALAERTDETKVEAVNPQAPDE